MESPRVTIESDSFQRASFGLFSGARRVFQLWNEAQKKHLSFVPKPIVEVAGGVSRVEMNAKNSALDIPPATTGALSRKTVDRSRRCHTRRYKNRRPVRNAGSATGCDSSGARIVARFSCSVAPSLCGVEASRGFYCMDSLAGFL